jgi:serine protease Do
MIELRGGFSLALCALVAGFGLSVPGCCKSPSPAAHALPDSAVRHTLSAVVRIEAIRSQPNQGRMVKNRVTGSGMIVSAQGHVLTNYHVADDADYYRCYFTDGTALDASCVGLDALTDLAVLKLDLSARPAGASPLQVATFGDSDKLQAGEPVWALGSPAALAQSVTAGIVSNASLVPPEEARIMLDGENVGLVVRWILHDASIFPGNSGGPLVDRDGRIVGINEIGIARLGGAIPGNLARRISDELIARGLVIRGWSGLTVQTPLEADRTAGGVLVADIEAGSPAANSGLQSGDRLTACNGRPIGGSKEVAVANFTTLEMTSTPGTELTFSYRRGEKTGTAKVVLATREPAQQRTFEQRTWGAVLRDISRELARQQHLPDTHGVWIESVRPGGATGQAEPELRDGDVVVAVEDRPVASLADLRAATTEILNDPAQGHDVLVAIRRDGSVVNAVVDLRIADTQRPTPQARRAWIGINAQPLTAKLATRLGVKTDSGVRVTQVHAGTRAASADLRVGDVILKIDGEVVSARRAEDLDAFARQVRRYHVDSEVQLTVWRGGTLSQIPITLEHQPVPAAELENYVDDLLELTVRELAFEDRTRLQLAPDRHGLIVQSLIAAGWAALAGLRNDDLLLEAGGKPLTDVASFREARDAALHGNAERWLLRIERNGRTSFIELDLKPLKT